jgi:4-hydroxybenzoate polyprenyltransferase
VKFIRLLNLLSIDVALGSVALGVLVVRMLNVSMPIGWWLVLPLTVWVIYSTDHLLDSCNRGINALSVRHLFHKKNFKLILSAIIFFIIIISLLIIFSLPLMIVLGGAIIAVCCFGYLIYARYSIKQSVPKELIVGFIYTIGIWFGPLMYHELNGWIWIPIVLTFLTAINNLVVFSIFGMSEDLKSGFGSIAIQFGKGRIIKWVKFLLTISVLLSLCYSVFYSNEIRLIITGSVFMVMNLVFLLMLDKQELFLKGDLYRIIGDGVFLFPLILNFF